MHLLGEQSTRVCTQAAANNSLYIALKDCLKNSSKRDTSAVVLRPKCPLPHGWAQKGSFGDLARS